MKMIITINKKNNNQPIVEIDGKLTIDNVIAVEDKLYQIIENNPEYIFIDFSKIKFIDSSGIGSLIKITNSSKNSNITLILFDIPDKLHDIFKHAYLDKFFLIYSSEDLKIKFPNLKF